MVVEDVAEVFLASEYVSSENCMQIRLDVATVRATPNGGDIAVRVANDELKVAGRWQVKTGQKNHPHSELRGRRVCSECRQGRSRRWTCA